VSRHSGTGRRKKAVAPENHERWLISYADFITLLFAFFVVMFASSQADRGRAEQMSESVRKALEGSQMASLIAVVMGGSVDQSGHGSEAKRSPAGAKQPMEEKKDPRIAELLPSLQVLSVELQQEIKAGEIQISMQQRGLVISFTQAALFPSGEDPQSGSPGRAHGLGTDPDSALSEQLGTVRGAKHRAAGTVVDALRPGERAYLHRRLRRYRARRIERHRSRPREEPARGHGDPQPAGGYRGAAENRYEVKRRMRAKAR